MPFHNQLNPDDVERVAMEAINAARDYFNLDPLWKIRFTLDALPDGENACVQIRAMYMQADITVDPAKASTLAQVWSDAGHEVAHLVLADLETVRAHIEQEEGGEWSALSRSFRAGVELAVTRLERAFARDRPYGEENNVGT